MNSLFDKCWRQRLIDSIQMKLIRWNLRLYLFIRCFIWIVFHHERIFFRSHVGLIEARNVPTRLDTSQHIMQYQHSSFIIQPSSSEYISLSLSFVNHNNNNKIALIDSMDLIVDWATFHIWNYLNWI